MNLVTHIIKTMETKELKIQELNIKICSDYSKLLGFVIA